MVLISLLHTIYSAVALASSKPAEPCRIIEFVHQVNGQALEGHTIETIRSYKVEFCEVHCFLNHDCVSYNFGPSKDSSDTYVCELNNSTNNKRLTPKAMYIYRESKDSCRSSPCLNNGKCQYGFTDKTFRCLCSTGFTGELCEKNTNECASTPCKNGGSCTDQVNGYNCSCQAGFYGSYCETDIDECTDGSHVCDINANCTNTEGSHNCSCKEGYIGDGKSCQDFDECDDVSSACNVYANCTNTNGSHHCTCKEGYTGDGQSCQDIDECSDEYQGCDVNANCTNTDGSHNCTCREGYSGDGQSCQDVDECLNGSYACDVNANCTNTYGSHNCTCEEGYIGDGQSCQDIDECSEAHGVKINICHSNASCLNTQGSYNCSCKPTYVGNGSICEADPCYNYQNLSDATRKSSYVTPNFPVLCDNQLLDGWYRFVGAAGTKMPTTRVPAYRCGTDWPGWLVGAHPSVEDGDVVRDVCFSDRTTGCKYVIKIPVKNCGSFFTYKLRKLPSCNRRYCGTD